MSGHFNNSINNNNTLELVNDDDDKLVDYEIDYKDRKGKKSGGIREHNQL